MHKLLANTALNKSRAELQEMQSVTSSFLTSINSSFVEFFPFLTYMPKVLQLWRPHWEEMGKTHYRIFKRWWDSWRPLASPTAQPSFYRDTILQHFDTKNPQSETQAMYTTILAINAGADNPRMALNALFMACLAYPGVIDLARQELDAVCGTDPEGRLPTIQDLPRLPFVCAMVKEVLRWRPTVPLMPQRVSVRDLQVDGYVFPKGTEFLVNSVAVCAHGFENPHEFRPDRWLGSEKQKGPENGDRETVVEQDLWQFAFNAGKRSCVGYKLAQKELFLACARLVYCFDITARGTFDDKMLNAFVTGEPFPVKIEVRGPMYEKLIMSASGDEASCKSWGI